MKKAKLENQLRLLQFEHDLQEEEIRSVEEERQSQKLGSEDVQSSMSRVQESVNNSEENGSIRNRSNSQPSITKAQVQGLQGKPRENEDPPGENRSNEINISQVNVGNTRSNDIQLLCQTVNNLLKRSSNDSSNNFHDTFLARQITDKDFPIFCGNPEEWPLFHEQYERVCKMCSFSQEEIMIKLRKCLRGEAKSAVAGMLLASENVPMVMDTWKMSTNESQMNCQVLAVKFQSHNDSKSTLKPEYLDLSAKSEPGIFKQQPGASLDN
ncbi:hypothetical protein JTB14_010685 [Gonioctena quinquepunctata]|nr:hypothetical protein JTB14_010685 [Gonioctena quinquepunctata]